MTPIGQMDRLVTIQQATETRDATTRAPKLTWTTLGTAQMAMRPPGWRERERFAANQVSAVADTVWHTTYRADMDPELIDVPKYRRLVYRGRMHEITGATHIGMRHELEFVTTASTRVS